MKKYYGAFGEIDINSGDIKGSFSSLDELINTAEKRGHKVSGFFIPAIVDFYGYGFYCIDVGRTK